MNQKIYSEDHVTTPLSPYALTKLKSENFMIKNCLSQSYILRLAPVYSKTFLLNIKRRTRILNFKYRIGDGRTKLSLCNLENILLVVNAVLKDKLPYGVYNVSDEREYSYNDLLHLAADKFLITLPEFILKILFYFSVMIQNIFLQENLIKLLSDNIYPSRKISSFMSLDYNLDDL